MASLSVVYIMVITDVTSILLRMNEIVDAANISQLNSNAPAVFPMGVRWGRFFSAHAVGVGGDQDDNAGEDVDGDGDNFKGDHDDVDADGDNFKGTPTG